MAPDLDDNIGIEDDPGPFELASPEKVAAFGPVLVMFPESGCFDVVLVEVSPLDVCHRERLRLDVHAMTHLTNVLDVAEVRRKGCNFQFCSAKKDHVAESFAILRGVTNRSVGTMMDEVLPASHSFSAHFKLLGHHGEHQEKWDDGNLMGGVGKGHRIDLGCCDHNHKGENTHGLGPTPRTNGGVKCSNKVTGNVEIDSHREELRNYFGAQMDAVQLRVDKVREEHDHSRSCNDPQGELANAAELRHELNAGHSRAEVSSNFVIAMDGHDGCSFHADSLNCSEPSCDWTCCSATAVESESTGRLCRVVTNLNSRAACGRAMQNEKKHASFKQGLATEMKPVDASHKEIHADRMDDLPTAQTHACLHLKDDLLWVDEIDGQGNNNRCIRMASAPSHAASAICNLGLKEVDIGCDTMVGMILIAMHMCSHQHLHAIGVAIKGDPGLVKRIQADLPGTCYETSERLFPCALG
jgi:hypothetical protein